MQEVYVKFQSTKNVQDFVRTLTPLDGDFELVSGRYLLDARSLMGLFSLDLSNPILLRVYNPSEENLKAIHQFEA